jgi:glycosyltransferase involved in cell wall biosynthesis
MQIAGSGVFTQRVSVKWRAISSICIWIGWRGTVYHGIPEDLYHLHETPGEYLAFLGRICPEKRVDRAIEIAKRSGRKLKIAAKLTG